MLNAVIIHLGVAILIVLKEKRWIAYPAKKNSI